MNAPMPPQLAPTIQGDVLTYSLSTKIYPLSALFRTCYWFTDRCYIYFSPGPTEEVVLLQIRPKNSGEDPAAIAGEFLNGLLDHTLRLQLAAETAEIRGLIYAQAFAEAGPGSDHTSSAQTERS